MRPYLVLVLSIAVIVGCSKSTSERTNFTELTLGGQKFTFDSLECILDTSALGIVANFKVYDRASNSSMQWETLTGTTFINGTYQFPGESYPGRSVVFLHIQTYINRVPGSYSLQNTNTLSLVIDKSENGRIHGTFSGKITCYTCTPYGAEVAINNGEFEMPYSYR